MSLEPVTKSEESLAAVIAALAGTLKTTTTILSTNASTETTLVQVLTALAATLKISAVSLPLPAGAATQTTLAAVLAAVQATQAISAVSLPLPTGAATEATLAKLPVYAATSAPVSPGVNVLLVSVVIAPANAARKGIYIYNNSANSAYMTFGGTSVAATCTALIPTFTSFVLTGSICYTGAISAIRNAGSGVCTVHELT